MTSPVKRGYASPLRDEQANQTRRSIVDAAAELFISQGYAATTMDAIAKAANVSRKTVFTAGGSKFALLKDAYDWSLVGDDQPIAMVDREPVQRIIRSTDPVEAVRLWVAMLTETSTRAAPMAIVLAAAAHVDAEAAELLRIADQHRLEGARAFVDHLETIGGLRRGLDPATATDVCWLAMDAVPFVRLVLERGWAPDHYRRWLGKAVQRELLADPRRSWELGTDGHDGGLRDLGVD